MLEQPRFFELKKGPLVRGSFIHLPKTGFFRYNNRMKKPSSAPEHSDSETIISAQADLRLRELETRVIRDDVERPPYYEYCIAKVPLTFQAVAQRAVCLAEGDEEWEEGIEEEMVPIRLVIDPNHVERALEETEIYRRDEMKLALKITKNIEERKLDFTSFGNLPAHVDGEDKYVKHLAQALTSNLDSKEEKASVLLSFVQSLEYHEEDDKRANFFQPPSFTLAYGGGGCDDLAILYASLLEAAEVDFRIIIAHTGDPDEKHALIGVAGDFEGFYNEQETALGVRMPDIQGTEFDGKFFAYAEPAQGNAIIGQRMSGHRNWHVIEEEPYTVGELKGEFYREVGR